MAGMPPTDYIFGTALVLMALAWFLHRCERLLGKGISDEMVENARKELES